jgi:hypothetical protein
MEEMLRRMLPIALRLHDFGRIGEGGGVRGDVCAIIASNARETASEGLCVRLGISMDLQSYRRRYDNGTWSASLMSDACNESNNTKSDDRSDIFTSCSGKD